MKPPARYDGTRRHLRAHWPGYATAYAGIVGALLGLAWSIARGSWAMALLLFLTTAVLVYFLVASLRATALLRDRAANDIAHNLFIMSQARPTDRLAAVDLGERRTALALASRLTSGKLFVLEVYHPQRTPGKPLVRLRQDAPAQTSDPRLEWYDCSISLLPLPDNSVTAVFLPEILSHFEQRGDRTLLLREVHRILRAEGRLLLAERSRTRANLLAFGPFTLRLETDAYWRDLLIQTGFTIRKMRQPQELITFLCASKPSPHAGRQLPLDLLFAEPAPVRDTRRGLRPRGS